MLNQSVAIDGLLHALADPTRRALVDHLARGPASVSELAAPLGVSLPAVMQHLKVLEGSGLVTTQKVGRVRRCALDPAGLGVVEAWAAERRAAWEDRFDRLAALVADLQPPDDLEPR